MDGWKAGLKKIIYMDSWKDKKNENKIDGWIEKIYGWLDGQRKYYVKIYGWLDGF